VGQTIRGGFLTLFVLCSIFARGELFAAQAAANWQADWDAMQRAAEKESRLVIYGPTGAEKLYSEIFQQTFPKIKVNYTPGRTSEMSRLDFRRRTDAPKDAFVRSLVADPIEAFGNDGL
jgi:hypothetical protein